VKKSTARARIPRNEIDLLERRSSASISIHPRMAVLRFLQAVDAGHDVEGSDE
jgi:hypothetical protein